MNRRPFALLSLLLLSPACASIQRPATPPSPALSAFDFPKPTAAPEDCRRWDEARLTWGTAGAVAGALGAGGALSTLTPLADDRTSRVTLGVVSVLLAATAAASAYQVDSLTGRYVTGCTVPVSHPVK